MIRICTGLLLIAYPFAIYFFSQQLSPLILIIGLGLLGSMRVLMLGTLSTKQRIYSCVGIACFCVLASLDDNLRTLKLYPVLINLGLAGAFVYTLKNPPSAIQRISIRLGMTVAGPAIPYTRRLTMVWIGFFLCSAAIASYTAVAASMQIWTLYNGLLSYVLIFLLLALEYPIRRVYQKRHGH